MKKQIGFSILTILVLAGCSGNEADRYHYVPLVAGELPATIRYSTETSETSGKSNFYAKVTAIDEKPLNISLIEIWQHPHQNGDELPLSPGMHHLKLAITARPAVTFENYELIAQPGMHYRLDKTIREGIYIVDIQDAAGNVVATKQYTKKTGIY